MSKHYIKYINSNEWKEKRIKILEDRLYKCERCSSTTHLQIHHWSYKHLWNEKDNELFCLCKICHKEFHTKYWFKNLLKSTKAFILNKPIIQEKTIRRRWNRITRKEANSIIPSEEFIEYVKSWWKYKWNTFTKSIRLFNSIVRRYYNNSANLWA